MCTLASKKKKLNIEDTSKQKGGESLLFACDWKRLVKLQGDMLALIEENAQKGSFTEDFGKQYQKSQSRSKVLSKRSWIV